MKRAFSANLSVLKNKEGEIKMKNRVLSLLLAALFLLLPLSFAGADGGSYYDSTSYYDSVTDSYLFGTPHTGIVICTKMNVRDRASTNGKSYGSIKNGQPVKILGTSRDGNFYVIDLQSCGFSNQAAGSYGYAKNSLIKIDPEFIATTKLTNLYATPWSTELKNGEQNGRFFLIIAEYGNWFAVQSAESTPGSAFIRAADVGSYSQYAAKYVVTWDTVTYTDLTTWAQASSVKRFTVGRLQDISGDYTLLLFNEGAANQFSAWVPSLYVAPIRN